MLVLRRIIKAFPSGLHCVAERASVLIELIRMLQAVSSGINNSVKWLLHKGYWVVDLIRTGHNSITKTDVDLHRAAGVVQLPQQRNLDTSLLIRPGEV